MRLYLDTETFSPVPIKQGTARYATQVEVMIVTWAKDDDPVRTEDLTRGPPSNELLQAIQEADEIVAHNAYFDRTVLSCQEWFRTLCVPLSKWRCSMATAYAHGLPGALDKICDAFKLPESIRKTDGKNYIDLFCKPQLKTQERFTRQTHPEEWRGFLKYAGQDIVAMREVYKRMPHWNMGPFELALWHRDQQINDRGFAVDIEMAKAAVKATTAAQKILSDRVVELTAFSAVELERATQRDKLLQHLLEEYGVALPDLTADTIDRRLEDPELPEFVKELLRIRQQASKSSTTKYKRILNVELAGRLYGTLQFCGANRTGRWGGRNVQPHNFPRPAHSVEQIELAIDALKGGFCDAIFDDVMGITSSALRSVIVAGPGRKLCVADLSNIEGRGLAWLAGEEWKLQAFRYFDSGVGEDLYKVAYGRAFGVDPATVGKDSDERQIGKVMELALGYQGGVGAFVTMAATYGVDLDLMAKRAWSTIPPIILAEARDTWRWAQRQHRTLGLSEKVYVVCEALKRLWRNAHPATVQIWEDVEVAARQAVLNPGHQFTSGPHLTFDRKGAWLRMRLPSGRFLCYPGAQLQGDKLTYMGVNPYSKKWSQISTYGGKLMENATQAMSRDVLAWAMPRVEDAGYPIVLTVHDELITEPVDSEEFNDKVLSELLSAGEEWTVGLPLAAKGFTAKRYRGK